MKGPPLSLGGEDICWPDQVAPWGGGASSTPKPQTANLKADEVLDVLFCIQCSILLLLAPAAS